MYKAEHRRHVEHVRCYLQHATKHLEGERALTVKNDIIRKVGACIEHDDMFDASSKKRQKAIVAGSAYKYASAVPVKRPCPSVPG